MKKKARIRKHLKPFFKRVKQRGGFIFAGLGAIIAAIASSVASAAPAVGSAIALGSATALGSFGMNKILGKGRRKQLYRRRLR
jgi:hypothetical protein